jgi:hypothetical protein
VAFESQYLLYKENGEKNDDRYREIDRERRMNVVDVQNVSVALSTGRRDESPRMVDKEQG